MAEAHRWADLPVDLIAVKHAGYDFERVGKCLMVVVVALLNFLSSQVVVNEIGEHQKPHPLTVHYISAIIETCQ